MIEHVRTVGFKGFDLDEPVPNKVIYSGRNKSGKTTRADAIALALYGYIPFSTAGKLPGDILESFGGESLVVSVAIGGKEFARKFAWNSKGGVSQAVQINKKTTSKENFAVFLGKAGAPKIADIAEFMKQSSAKKVDTLFEIFPNEALAGIDALIQKDKEDVSRLEKKIKGAESVVVQLTNSKQAIQTPSGTIASVQAEIISVESQILDLEEQINQANIEAAEAKKEKETKEKIASEGGMSRDEAIKVIKDMSPGESHEQIKPENDRDGFGNFDNLPSHGGHAFIDGGIPEVENRFGSPADEETRDFKKKNFPQSFPTGNEVIPPGDQVEVTQPLWGSLQVNFSINRIIAALEGAGCGTCAALIVAKQELKKFKGVS